MDSPSEVTSIVPAVPNRTPYRYRPLQNGDDIRLVRILPGTLQQEICCEIVHGRKASRKHEYEALSYVWGDPSIVKQISIIPELSNFSVTSNCFDALRRLRWKRSPRLVWIDALCINQTDNEERIQQVREMGEIYSLSERVIVYLGESDKVSTVIFNYLRKTEHNFGRYPGESFASGIAEAVHAFLKRPWFSRVWVLQEVFNGSKFAKSGVIVLCGNETISWMHLADTCREFCKSDTDASDNYKPPSPYALNLVHGEKFDNIFDVLCATRSLNATDPRDKFFGVLAIVRESPKGDLQKLASYGQTTTMLYTQIGLHLLSIWQLVILQFSRHPHDNYPNLSSWIPDWTHGNGHENVWVSKPWVPAFYDQRSFEPEIRTLACCRATCPESDHLYHPILTATGFRLSQITSLGAIFDFKESGERCRDAVDRVLDSKGQCEDNPYLPQGFTSACKSSASDER